MSARRVAARGALPLALFLTLISARSTPVEPVTPAEPLAAETAPDLPKEAKRGVQWLVAQQTEDGFWSSTQAQAGTDLYEVGVTGLALMALMESGRYGGESDVGRSITRGVDWLVERVHAESGRVGDDIVKEFHYMHATATIALCNAYAQAPNEELEAACRLAVRYVLDARRPKTGWRYEPELDEVDTSITSWMVDALVAAREAGLVDDLETVTSEVCEYLVEMTDVGTGRVGYTARGSLSSRVPGMNDNYPRNAENLTAHALLAQRELGSVEELLRDKGVELLLTSLPVHSPTGITNDYLYWYYGSRYFGGASKKQRSAALRWRKATKKALKAGQVRKGDDKGSWEPNGPWCYTGGRVYATSLAVLAYAAL
ncbi:MAG: prenyltransferase/squalene oxidase repeat-containing protein [Planctomycetota bacterium]